MIPSQTSSQTSIGFVPCRGQLILKIHNSSSRAHHLLLSSLIVPIGFLFNPQFGRSYSFWKEKKKPFKNICVQQKLFLADVRVNNHVPPGTYVCRIVGYCTFQQSFQNNRSAPELKLANIIPLSQGMRGLTDSEELEHNCNIFVR